MVINTAFHLFMNVEAHLYLLKKRFLPRYNERFLLMLLGLLRSLPATACRMVTLFCLVACSVWSRSIIPVESLRMDFCSIKRES